MVHVWARERVPRPSEAWTAVASILALSSIRCTSWQPFTSQLVLHHELNFAIWTDMGKPNNDQLELCRIWYACAWQLYRAQSIVTLKICFLSGMICVMIVNAPSVGTLLVCGCHFSFAAVMTCTCLPSLNMYLLLAQIDNNNNDI
jgi:hypothetical protein